MKTITKGLFLALIMSTLVGFAAPALAYNPSLNVSGNTITITGGQPNASVVINYTPSGSSLQTTVTGTTDYNGYFSTQVGFISSQVTATVGGQPVYQNGNNGSCSYNCGSPNGLSLSQNSLNLNIGQSSVVTAINYNSSSYNNIYISSNTNPSVATVSLNGNQLTVYGQNIGSTSITVCSYSSNSSCPVIYVTVGGNNNCGLYSTCGNLVLSPSTLNLNSGQSSTVTVSSNNPGSGIYISSNSNSSVASATANGNSINVYAINSGSSTISVCQNSGSGCATLYVTVNGNNGCSYNCGNNGGLPLSQTNVNLNVGQTTTVTAFNNNGNLYISSNSNASVVTVSISGSAVALYGLGNGSSTVSVCSNGNNLCSSIYVTVGGGNNCGYSNCNGSFSLSQTSLNLGISQSATVAIYGAGGFYVSSNSNSGVVSASVAGTTLYLNSLSSGSSTISVCQALGSVQCASLYVTVNGNGNNGCTYNCGSGNSAVWFSQTTANLNVGQSQSLTIYSNNYGGGYYISSNNNSGMVSANVVGNSLNLYGQSSGYSTVTVCQTSGSSNCGSVYVTVGNGSNNGCTYNCGNGNGAISLSQTSLSLTAGQSASVNIFGSGSYYTSVNSNSAVSTASVSGSTLNVYAVGSGTNNIAVCQNGGVSGCATLYVTVNGSGNGCTYNCGNGGGVLGASSYPSGELINSSGTVYIVYQNMQTPFANAAAFTGLGFSFNNVLNVGATGLSNSGYTVTTSRAQHPWGAWIKSGQTVYFVHQNGLIPVPNWSTFLNNNGQQNFIVPANSWDLSLPILSVMVNSDPRVQ